MAGRGSLVASDSTDHDGMGPFLAYLREPANGCISTGVLTPAAAGRAATRSACGSEPQLRVDGGPRTRKRSSSSISSSSTVSQTPLVSSTS